MPRHITSRVKSLGATPRRTTNALLFSWHGRLLSKLTHSKAFAEQLVELQVHVPLLHVCTHASDEALVLAREVLVNVLLLCPAAAPSFTQSGVFQ